MVVVLFRMIMQFGTEEGLGATNDKDSDDDGGDENGSGDSDIDGEWYD